MWPYQPPVWPTLFLAAAAFTWFVISAFLGRAEGLPVLPIVRFNAAIAITALVGGKSATYLSDGNFGPAFSGFSSAGALLLLFVLIPLFVRCAPRECPIPRWADVTAPATGFAIAIMRVECLLAGCCYGRESSVPWAISFPPMSPAWLAQLGAGHLDSTARSSMAVHPLQIYFLIAAVGAGLVGLWLLPRRTYEGQVGLAFMALYGTSKFALEFFRTDASSLRWGELIVGVGSGALMAFVLGLNRLA